MTSVRSILIFIFMARYLSQPTDGIILPTLCCIFIIGNILNIYLPNSGVVVSGPALKAFTAKKLSPSSPSVSGGIRAITEIRSRTRDELRRSQPDLDPGPAPAPTLVPPPPLAPFLPAAFILAFLDPGWRSFWPININDGGARVLRVATIEQRFKFPAPGPATLCFVVRSVAGCKFKLALFAGQLLMLLRLLIVFLLLLLLSLVKHSASVASSSSSADCCCWDSHCSRVSRLRGSGP